MKSQVHLKKMLLKNVQQINLIKGSSFTDECKENAQNISVAVQVDMEKAAHEVLYNIL